jgi:GTP-binding protein HflX
MQKAYLIGIEFKDDLFSIEYQFLELKNLLNSLDIEVVGSTSQKKDYADKNHYLNIKKLEEIKLNIENSNLEVDMVIFNDPLTSSQLNNIEKFFEKTVLDRSYLILEIFSKRASTREAILEVDLAKLKYMYPRLIGLNNSLDRQSGSSGAFKSKGSGEKKLELDRRTISNKIVQIEKKLLEISTQRDTNREKRKNKNFPVVSLVGYTNAGKSATMNNMLKLSKSNYEVFEKDLLFATLSTTSKRIKLKHFKDFILNDTVGFLSKLPHELISSFRSTLEEIKYSDLILHVVDCTNPFYEHQIEVTNKVLEEIGVLNTPMIYVFNKMDLLNDNQFISSINDYVLISNKTLKNFDFLLEQIKEKLTIDYSIFQVNAQYQNAKLINYIEDNCYILNKIPQDSYIEYTLKINDQNKAFILKFLKN